MFRHRSLVMIKGELLEVERQIRGEKSIATTRGHGLNSEHLLGFIDTPGIVVESGE